MNQKNRHSFARKSRRTFIQSSSALALASQLPKTAFANTAKLYFYNWDDYIGENTLKEFNEKFGIEVQTDFFGGSEEQFAKLRSGNSGYDVTVPTQDYTERMAKAGLLLKLDHSKIPNLANLFENHQNPAYDPNNQYSIPYMWGSLGIGYRKSAVEKPTSWEDVLTKKGIQKNGNVAWLSESVSMVPVTSMFLGKKAIDTTDANFDEVFKLLTDAKPYVVKLAEDNGQDLLASGEIDMAIEWNGDIAQLMVEDDDIDFVIPKEGSIYVVDTMAILADSKNPEGAHTFLNYILDAEAGAKIAEYIAYATANKAAYYLTHPDYRNNPVTFPKEVDKLEVIKYLGEEALDNIYRRWELLLAS